MVDAPRSLQAALGRGLVVEVEAAALLAARFPATVHPLELERLEQTLARLRRRGVGAHRVEALQRQLARHLGVVGDQRLVGHVDDQQLVVEPLGIGEDEAVAVALGLDAVGAQALGPEVEGRSGGDPPDDPVHHPRARPSRGRAGVLEEGQVGAGVPRLVGEKEVVDGRVVLVDGFLDQPQTHHAGVEVDVALGVLGDRGDVVNAL